MEYRQVVVSICKILKSVRGTGAVVQASIASISRWTRSIEPRHRVGPRNDGLITDIMLLAIKARIMERPCSTAQEIQTMLKDNYNVHVSRQLVQNVLLKRLNLSYKRTRKRGMCLANDPIFRARYKTFIIELQKCIKQNKTIVSIDESGVDARARPLYGRALKGKPCIIHAPPNDVRKHIRTSLIMAIASNNESSYQMLEGNVTGNEFADFILNMPYPSGSIILIDNHSMHNTPSVQVAFHVKGYHPMFLPPHCPELNPIEMMFGTIKTDYYKLRYSPDFKNVSNALQSSINMHCTPNKITNYMDHVFKFVDDQSNMYTDDKEIDSIVIDLSLPWKRQHKTYKTTRS